MADAETATRWRASTSFSRSLKRGPWPREVTDRLVAALDRLAQQLRELDGVVGVIVFGSYARGEFGRKSDVDLLILFEGNQTPDQTDVGREALRRCGEIEAEYHLPMHLAPLLGRIGRPADLGPDLIHAIWTDGIVWYGEASALARFQPAGLAPWAVFRFSTTRLSPTERVRLSRRLHGFGRRAGLVQSPGLVLGPGSLLVPADQQNAIRDALDAVGASYDVFPIWREG